MTTRLRTTVVAALATTCTVLAVTTPTATGSVSDGRETFVRTVGIDTSKKAVVRKAYLRRFGSNLGVKAGWTGTNKPCRPGRISTRARRATLESVNFVRAMAGLEPVVFNRIWSAKAQKAALIMSANGWLSHYPPKSARCWTKAGAEAAGASNLAIAWPSLTPTRAIEMYMDDDDPTNKAVGHRRWILYPWSTRVGIGNTTTTNALWVVGKFDYDQSAPAWVPWPTAGWFPAPLEPNGRWSLGATNESTNFRDARVTVRNAAGKRMRVNRLRLHPYYGSPTLVWDVSGLKDGGRYRVVVSNIKQKGKGTFTRRYRVHLFDPTP